VQTTEPEWDDHNRAVVSAYLDYQAELHTCGRPLSESLHVAGQPDPEYVIGELTCVACRKSAAYVEKHHKEHGVPPHAVIQVYTRAEALAISTEQSGR
jgi:hypothetical protein